MHIPNLQSGPGSTGQQLLATGAFILRGLPINGLKAGMQLNAVVARSDTTSTLLSLIDGSLVELAGETGLNPGDDVQLTVTTVRPQIQVRVALSSPQPARTAEDLGLRDGQQTTARVLAKNPDGTVQVALNGRVVNAEAPPGVEVGTLLPVVMQEDGGRIVMNILRGNAGVEVLAQHFLRERDRARDPLGRNLRNLLTRLQTIEGENESQSGPLSALRQLLELFQLATEPEPQSIQHSLQDGGLFLEHHLASSQPSDAEKLQRDLKAALLKASQQSPADDPQTTELIQNAAHEIERLQLSNVLTQLQEGALIWQLPGWPNSSPISLRIEPDDKTVTASDQSSSAWQFLVALEMEKLGSIHVDARLTDKSLRAIFYLASPLVDVVNAALNELKTDLTHEDFAQVWLAARSTREIPPDLQLKFRHTIEGTATNPQVLDIRG